MQPLRVVFYGSPDFAVASLLALQQMPDVELIAVITQPDKPAGRKRLLSAPPVKVAAAAHAIPIYQWTKLRDGEAERVLVALRPDIAVVAAYGRILPKALLDAPARGSVNVHASLLPAWRGASPINHALLAGDAHTGVSLMQMDEGLDTGPVFVQKSVPIRPDDTTESLTRSLATLGGQLLQEHLLAIANQTCRANPQPDVGVSHAPLLVKEQGQLDFSKGARVLEREVRAFFPWPGSHFTLEGTRIVVLAASALDESEPSAAPGSIAFVDERGLGLACREGVLVIERLRPAGRNEMSARAFIAGRAGKIPATLR